MDIKKYFQMDDFSKALSSLKAVIENNEFNINRNIIGYFVSISIKYFILFGETDDFSVGELNQFIEDVAGYVSCMDLYKISNLESDLLLNKYVSELCVNNLLKKFNLTINDLEDKNIEKAVGLYIIMKLKGKEYKYHAFNSLFYDSIKKYGINPNVKNISQLNIDKIDEIFKKYGIINIFGWQKINCVGNVCYSETPKNSYYYGLASPEWFAHFTGQSFYYMSSSKYKKTAFMENDYGAARQNILTLMNEKNFSKEDMDSVIEFFETNWKMYANGAPMLAIISGECDKELCLDYLEMFENDTYCKTDLWGIFINCFNYGNDDCRSSEVIDTSNAIFIELPDYKQLINKICFQQIEVSKKERK